MTNLYERGLALIDNWFRSIHLEFYPGFRMAIVGPDMDELKEFAPTIADAINDGAGESRWLHLPVGPDTDLERLIDTKYRDGESNEVIFAISPDRLEQGDLGRLSKRTPPQFRNLDSPYLLLTLLMSGGGIALLPTDELEKDAHAPTRAAIASHLRTELDRRLSGSDRRALLYNPPPSKRPVSISGEWHVRPLFPKSIWRLPSSENGPAMAFVRLVHGNNFGHGFGDFVHYRACTNDCLEQMLNSCDALRHLYDTSCGWGTRDEDDVLVPLEDALRSARWRFDQVPASLTESAVVRGLPTVPLSKLCVIGAETQVPDNPSAKENTLWLATSGGAAPSLITRNPKDTVAVRGVSLTIRGDGVDTVYLQRTLRDSYLMDVLRSRSLGSWDEPRVLRHTIASLVVPWPPRNDREKHLADWKAAHAAGQAINSDNVKYFSDGLSDAVDALLDRLASPEFMPPYLPPATVAEDVASWWQDLHQAMSSALSLAGAQSSAAAPPIVLGYIRRRLANESNADRRVQHLITLADTMLKYDALILMALVRSIAPETIADMLRRAWKSRYDRGDWRMTSGDWQQVRRAARRILGERRGGAGPFSPLVESVLMVDDRKVDQTLDEVIEIRNSAYAHMAAAPFDASVAALARALQDHLSEVAANLKYHNEFPLFAPIGRRAGPKVTELDVVWLTHDNPIMPKTTVSVDRGDAVDRETVDGEVGLAIGRFEAVLSLHPFVIFRSSPLTNQPYVWMWDSIEGRRPNYRTVRFKSPLGPDEHLLVDELLGEYRALLEV